MQLSRVCSCSYQWDCHGSPVATAYSCARLLGSDDLLAGSSVQSGFASANNFPRVAEEYTH